MNTENAQSKEAPPSGTPDFLFQPALLRVLDIPVIPLGKHGSYGVVDLRVSSPFGLWLA